MFLAPNTHSAFFSGPRYWDSRGGNQFRHNFAITVACISVGSGKHATRLPSSTSFLSSRFEQIVKISAYEILCRAQVLLNSRWECLWHWSKENSVSWVWRWTLYTFICNVWGLVNWTSIVGFFFNNLKIVLSSCKKCALLLTNTLFSFQFVIIL